MTWDENKHPRDSDGKFTEKDNRDSPNNIKRFHKFENPSKKLHKKEIINLTKQEWALYYKCIADEKYGTYIYSSSKGQRWVRIETDYSNKIIIDNGLYQDVRVEKVLAFNTSDELSDALDYFKRNGEIK